MNLTLGGRRTLFAAVAAVFLLAAGPVPRPAPALPPLPQAVTNNAVAAGRIGGAWWAFSALGIDATKVWSGITRHAFAWSDSSGAWQALPDVPGDRGRLAATAQVVGGKLYLFGGYTVDAQANEHSLPNVDIYDPATGKWTPGAPIPLPVDDAVSGVYQDRWIYLVSGWHETDNVRDVQVYDVTQNRWSVATPIPGPGVFGHTGGLAGNRIVFVDGAARHSTGPKYGLVPQVWVGTIDAQDPTRIAWEKGPPHPGPALYRAAAAPCGNAVVFVGGTANPYNYNGIGYDQQPSAPRQAVFAFDVVRGAWRTLAALPTATMDHRGIAVLDGVGWIVGGMRDGQEVSAGSVRVELAGCQ